MRTHILSISTTTSTSRAMSFLPHGSTPKTSGFTCNTCQVRFVTAELQRQHMRTEWHRYNLKRRVAQLPTILSEIFAEKVLEQQQAAEQNNDEDEFGFHVNQRHRSGGERQLTKKDLKQLAKLEAKRGRTAELGAETGPRTHSPATSVASELSAFSLGESVHYSEAESNFESGSEFNHSDSVHSDLDSWKESGDDSDEYTLDEEEQDDAALEILPNTHCFYCGSNNHELESNVRHMAHRHGLYIPERTYLTDLEGLLTFLNEVVTLDHECLVCGFQGKSLESIRQHIHSKGHCRIPYETKEEKLIVLEFYNFRIDEEPVQRTKKESKKVSFREVPDTDYVDVGSGDDLSDESQNGNGIYDNYSTGLVDSTGVELTLPTGSRVGHRSMVKYYRQNLPLPREYPESNKTVALVDRRFAPGLSRGEVTKQEKEVRKMENRARNDHERKTKTRRANYQAHFRDEILGT